MSIDLHDALTTLAAAAPPSEPPTTALLRRVHQRRASRAMTTSAVGVVAAGAAATSSLGWWPDLSGGPAPANDYHAIPATDAPVPAGSTAPWDLYPGASIDVATVPTRTVTEALAALTVTVPMAGADDDEEQLLLMDATDGAWVRPAWRAEGRPIQLFALSPDGRTVVAWVFREDRTPGVDLIDVASGARTPVTGLALDGRPCLPGGADVEPSGATIAVLTTCGAGEDTPGETTVFRVDPDTGAATTFLTVAGTNLASGGRLEYSPDGSLLAVSAVDVAEPYTSRTLVVDGSGGVVREWAAALRSETVWYGNDALRASELEQTADGEWKGWLIPSTGAAVGEIRSYDEQPWEYGPAPALLGRTHGQEVRAHTTTAEEAANPADAQPWAFDLEDAATGTVRSWLPVLDSTAPADRQPVVVVGPTALATRTR